jgi:hypothetical protein
MAFFEGSQGKNPEWRVFANWILKVAVRRESAERTLAGARPKRRIADVSIAAGPEDLMRIQFIASRQSDSGVKW